MDRGVTSDGYLKSYLPIPGADPGFQVRGAHLKKWRRAEGGAKILGVFRVKKIIFFPILGARAPGAPPSGSAPDVCVCEDKASKSFVLKFVFFFH